jgi:hypothetical protein
MRSYSMTDKFGHPTTASPQGAAEWLGRASAVWDDGNLGDMSGISRHWRIAWEAIL